MSAKSAASKLRIEPKTTIWSSHPDRLAIIGNLPEGVRPAAGPGEADTAVVFGDDGKSVQ
jgi:hypothetical protein